MKKYQSIVLQIRSLSAQDVLTQSQPNGDGYEYDPFMQ